jgi:hypothetical protein
MPDSSRADRTSVIDLETTLGAAEIEPEKIIGSDPKKAEKKSHRPTQAKAPKKAAREGQNKIAELRELHKSRLQAVIKKHQEEKKQMQRDLKDQTKKNQYDLKLALGQAEKTYRTQLELLRKDYESRSVSIRNELKEFLAGEMEGIKKHSESVVESDSQERLEKLEKWIHGEFLGELQNKSKELEQVKVSADSQVHDLVKEIDQKNKEISFLQEKIKEISDYMPEEEQDDLYEELGFEHEVEDAAEEPKQKRKKKGFFSFR